ncbi:hypothetical protein H310_06765 [Aphanomyces invadans]|uniref:Uncharacterized protein n=1 Tax=Aphanomyces invadans TaxID=157072 RepID=A0A024U4J9_9STRA|nr:hypothetical protein H310_06765 [Aphanomyces invadans]ETW01165.1 hypothetical protein H310_06765 [Aphanomyces invadans]|eukprot:XP_008870163.1 hypothetical protein H310_06765 [Aphanomyces invadans]
MTSQLPPLRLDSKPDLKDIDLEDSNAVAPDGCSSVGSEVNLIDDNTPSKPDIKDTPLTKMNLVAMGSSASPLLTYKTWTNILFSLVQPAIVVGYLALFHGICAAYAKPGVSQPSFPDPRHTVLGALAFSTCECTKWTFEWIAKKSGRGTLKDGSMYLWGVFGAVVCTSLDDVVRVLFVWLFATTSTFSSAFSFGVGWGCVEVVCHMASFASLCLNRAWSFHEATRLQRMLTRVGIRYYSFVVLVHHFFSVACGVGASLVAFKSEADGKFVLVWIVLFLRLIGSVVQNESLRRRCSIWNASLVLFLLEVVILLLGLSLWQWGAAVDTSIAIMADTDHRHHSSLASATEIPSTTASRHSHHKGHHHPTPRP